MLAVVSRTPDMIHHSASERLNVIINEIILTYINYCVSPIHFMHPFQPNFQS